MEQLASLQAPSSRMPPPFISLCPVLEANAGSYLDIPTTDLYLPDPASGPELFAHIMLGINWIEDIKVQVFCINFLVEL